MSSGTAGPDYSPDLLTEKQRESIDLVLSSDAVPDDVKRIAEDIADRYNYDPDIGGSS